MAGSVIVAGARTPIGKLSGALAGFTAIDLGGFAITAALERAGVSPDQVDYVLMGQVLLAGQGQITARQAAVEGRHPDVRPRQHDQQGVPVGPQHDLPGRPDDRRRRRRHRGGRRHGVDDQGALPAARRPGRLPPRRRRAGRLDDVRRPVVRVRPRRHGPRDRAATTRTRRRSPASARTRSPPRATSGRPRRSRTGASPTRSSRSSVPQRKGDPILVDTDEGVRPGHHGRVARRAAAGLRQERHDHGRQRLADLRRRLRGHRDVGRQGRRSSA